MTRKQKVPKCRGEEVPTLQWGRVMDDAETSSHAGATGGPRPGFNGAASWMTRKLPGSQLPVPDPLVLQWGRVMDDAETAPE